MRYVAHPLPAMPDTMYAMRTVKCAPRAFRYLSSVVEGCGEWSDSHAPRTDEPARLFYHWERGVGLTHVGNVCAPWGRNVYIPR